MALLPETMKSLFDMTLAQYTAQLDRMPLKKSVRESLIDGFKDGLRAGMQVVNNAWRDLSAGK